MDADMSQAYAEVLVPIAMIHIGSACVVILYAVDDVMA